MTDHSEPGKTPRYCDLAVWSLALGIVGLCATTLVITGASEPFQKLHLLASLAMPLAAPLAITFGILALRRIRISFSSSEFNNNPLAITGIIIAILTFGFYTTALPIDNKGNSNASKTSTIISKIELGLKNYHLEYGTYPDLGNDFTTDRDNGIELLSVLLAQTDHENAKNIKFVEIREGRNFKDGVIWDPKTSELLGLYDPWGNAYVIHIGSKTANEAHFKWGSKFMDLKDRNIAIYSPGRDHKAGTSDDICSWNRYP